MEFGRVDDTELSGLDFTLPADTQRTARILGSNSTGKPEIYVGCAKWGRKEWVGKIYPKGTKDKDFLEAYGKQFNCIEFNAIFYKLPSHEQVRIWKSKVKPDFKFCPKFTDVITHIKRLKNAKHETDLLLDVLSEFGDQLGPMFLMPHPQMGPKHYDAISEYLQSLPRDINVFLELRHPDWYIPANMEQIFSFCEAHGVGTVITDTSGRRDCAHMELTVPEVFIRFVGNGLHPTDYTRIDEWVQRIRQWMNKGIRKVWFFMHQHDEQYSPELCKYLIDELNAECGLSIPSPKFVTETNATLF
jgi:uncharacterized protein YecE (DUF72 family)